MVSGTALAALCDRLQSFDKQLEAIDGSGTQPSPALPKQIMKLAEDVKEIAWQAQAVPEYAAAGQKLQFVQFDIAVVAIKLAQAIKSGALGTGWGTRLDAPMVALSAAAAALPY